MNGTLAQYFWNENEKRWGVFGFSNTQCNTFKSYGKQEESTFFAFTRKGKVFFFKFSLWKSLNSKNYYRIKTWKS